MLNQSVVNRQLIFSFYFCLFTSLRLLIRLVYLNSNVLDTIFRDACNQRNPSFLHGACHWSIS